MSKETEIVKLLRQYMAAYPNMNMADGAWAIYARALSPLSIGEINAAMLKLLRNSKYFPTVAEIFEAARSVREYADGESALTPADAWKEVMELVKKHGVYKKWTYSTPEVQKAAECFGRYELCMLEESKVGIARGQFMKLYSQIVDRAASDRENQSVIDALPKAQKDMLGRGKIIELAEAKRA